MALSDVVSLKPDDIMPIELLNTVPVSIGNQPLLLAVLLSKTDSLF